MAARVANGPRPRARRRGGGDEAGAGAAVVARRRGRDDEADRWLGALSDQELVFDRDRRGAWNRLELPRFRGGELINKRGGATQSG